MMLGRSHETLGFMACLVSILLALPDWDHELVTFAVPGLSARQFTVQ